LETIGYKDEVVFPVTAVLAVPDKTVFVRLLLDYAVCRDICVPLKADLALLVPEGTGEETPHAALIKDFSVRVPQTLPDPAAIGVPELRKVCFEDNGADGRLRVVFSGLETGGDQDLFVEAGGGFGFGAPETAPDTVTVDQEGGVEMTVPVHRYRKQAVLKTQPVRLTLVAGEGAFEWSTTVCPD
jgi:suppressor for copper-sensitivity B